MTKPIINALTLDVEDYFHVNALSEVIDPSEWEQWPRRVERNTESFLDLYAKHGLRGTLSAYASMIPPLKPPLGTLAPYAYCARNGAIPPKAIGWWCLLQSFLFGAARSRCG